MAAAVRIVEYTPDRLPELVASYACAVATTPHCHPGDASVEEWAAELADLAAEATAAGTKDCSSRKILLAEGGADGELLGFVDVCVWAAHSTTEWGPGSTGRRVDVAPRGLIRFLWYERGQRRAGEALVDAAEAHVSAAGMVDMAAFDQGFRYAFYMIDSAYYSLANNHVLSLLEARGYVRCNGECYYDWPNYSIPDELAPLPEGLSFRMITIPGKGRLPGTAVYAVSEDGKDLGVCVTTSTGEYSKSAVASATCFTKWLGVPVSPTSTRLHPSQGQGLGKCLLAESLRLMKTLGYKHATISTALMNHKAQLFYSNFGYGLTGWTVGLERSLADQGQSAAPRL
jgi:GNAT superfamily N-acetyltransferase